MCGSALVPDSQVEDSPCILNVDMFHLLVSAGTVGSVTHSVTLSVTPVLCPSAGIRCSVLQLSSQSRPIRTPRNRLRPPPPPPPGHRGSPGSGAAQLHLSGGVHGAGRQQLRGGGAQLSAVRHSEKTPGQVDTGGDLLQPVRTSGGASHVVCLSQCITRSDLWVAASALHQIGRPSVPAMCRALLPLPELFSATC